jgi:hypothetical protein
VDASDPAVVPIVLSIASVALIISSFVSTLRALARVGRGGRTRVDQTLAGGEPHVPGGF